MGGPSFAHFAKGGNPEFRSQLSVSCAPIHAIQNLHHLEQFRSVRTDVLGR